MKNSKFQIPRPVPTTRNSKFLFLLLLLSGCRSLDEDTAFFPETQSAFLLCPDSAGTGKIIVKITDGIPEFGYNQNFGISNSSLSDMRGKLSTLWICSGAENKIQKIDLSGNSLEETYAGLELQPYFICPGDKYLLISDSTSNRIGFLKIKSGEIFVQSVSGKPGKALFNNGKFYLDIGGVVNIYSESAMTAYSWIPTNGTIVDIHLDAYKQVQVHFRDTTSNFFIIIDGNGDLQSGTAYPAAWNRARYTPYYYSEFDSELLQSLFLINNQINLGSTVLPDSSDAFECDFFESRLFSTWGDSLSIRALPENILETKLWFPYKPESAFFFVTQQGD